MRVVEPDTRSVGTISNVKRKNHLLKFFGVILMVSSVSYGMWFLLRSDTDKTQHDFMIVDTNEVEASEDTKQIPSENSGSAVGDEKYQSLWYSLSIPDSKVPEVAPELNNDTEFSRFVSSLAEARGYRLQKVYTGDNLGQYRGVQLEKILILPLQELISEAKQAGLALSISSAYRSLYEQENIFMSRYNQQRTLGLSQSDAIQNVLEGAAPPGYSKHHSAYTVDMTCSGLGAKNFIGTECDVWLSDNDYENAKKHGFIPSYPRNIDVQGPAPEPWEYNYVGRQTLQDLNLL